MIVFDLSQNDAGALLRHVEKFEPQTGDTSEDARLRYTLLELRDALMNMKANGVDPLLSNCEASRRMLRYYLSARVLLFTFTSPLSPKPPHSST